MATLYWHDYESWGLNPAVDRPAQFAGVRTDEDLNILGEPLVIYCQPPADVLPHAEACLVTGIAPQKALNEGMPEARFIAQIHRELAAPGTVGVGYNSLNFDDEMTRYTLYRNFYDPYEREWKNGNGRWDIINMVRLCYAVRPEGIEWPMEEGRPSFRLERLTEANGIVHAAAHDAYSDVEATIKLAALIRTRQRRLYDYVYQYRHKNQASTLIDWREQKPLLHISSKYRAENGCAAIVMPLAMHPTNKNAVIVYDLSVDPTPLITLDEREIAERVFVKQSELPEGEHRLPLKLVHLNKCPVLTTVKLLDEAAEERLQIDKALCAKHWQFLRTVDIAAKVQAVMSSSSFPSRQDPEAQLYDGFIPRQDQEVMADLRRAGEVDLRSREFVFTDPRLNEMVWRYKARNFPSSLNEVEERQWFEFCRDRLANGSEGVQSIDELTRRLQQIDEERSLNKEQKIVLQQLYRYAMDLARKYQVGPKCRW